MDCFTSRTSDIDATQLLPFPFFFFEGNHLFPHLLSSLQGKNLLVIGTTSEVGFLESIGMCDVFSVTYHVPKLKKEDATKVRGYTRY
jgi:hypothetical protein